FKDTKFSGHFSDKNTKITAKSTHYINNISKDSLVYFGNKNSTLNLNMELDNVAKKLKINTDVVTIEEMNLDVTGDYNFKEETYKLLANTKNFKISDAFSLMPKNVNKKLQEYSTKGIVEGKAVIEKFKGNNQPNITAKFDIKEGTLTENTTKATLTNLVV